jgi:hypothetical protein
VDGAGVVPADVVAGVVGSRGGGFAFESADPGDEFFESFVGDCQYCNPRTDDACGAGQGLEDKKGMF